MTKVIKYNFLSNEAIYFKHNFDGNILMSYYVTDYKYPETLIASYVDKIFVYIGDVIVSLVYAKKDFCNYFFHVRKIEIYPEFNYAKVYCLNDKTIKKRGK